MAKDIKPANPNAASSEVGGDPKDAERKSALFKVGRKLACIKAGRKPAACAAF